MTKFADLLQKPAPKEEAEERWSLDDSTEQTFAEEETPGVATAELEMPAPVSPMDALKQTLEGIKKQVPLKVTVEPATQEISLTAAQMNQEVVVVDPDDTAQFQNPTMTDVSNYVFEEQPDESTEEITAKFDGLLSDLVNAVGVDIPNLLAQNLNFIKEHPFLAEILKPESIGHLCNAMRKSYGHVVQAKAERTKKATVRSVKEQSVLDSMSGLTF